MKKILSLTVMCLLLLCGLKPQAQAQTVWDGTADISWYDASQTSFDISTPEQLAGVASLVNSGTSFSGVTLNLTADIWLNSTGDSTNNWTPIGGGSPTGESPSTGSAFKGNFNGHGHSIYNLYCDKGSTFHAGLFCAVENPCTIDSLVMVNPVLKSRGMMGCIAGFPRGSNSVYIRYCLVINARIVGENSSGSNNIGGIVGASYPNSGSTYIQNCGVTGSITGHYPGGIAGNAERSNITNAYFAGTLFAYSTNYGGMTAHGGNRTNCYSYTQVLSSTSQSSASSDGTSVTQAEMQSASMITLLGDAFTMDIGINDGYPIMSYMAGITPSTAEICVGESVTLTAHGLDSYVWNTGATTESITVSPTTTTTYTVSGTYQGMSVTLSSVITVYPQAVISATVMAGSDGSVHGTVTPDTSYVACMSSDNITLTVTPDAGYRIESVTLNGDEVYGDVFGPGEQTLTLNPNGTLGEVKIYLSKCAIVTLPFTDDFESYASSSVPECYTRISNYTYPYVYDYNSYAHSGNKSIYTYMYGSTYPYYLVLPKMFDMNTYPMESLQVNFWARTSNINNSVTVGVMSDPNDASTFTAIETFTFEEINTYYEYVCYFGAAAAGKPYIAFKYNCGSSYSLLYMDDVTVDVAPTCSPVTHLTVDNIYGTNASLHWDANVIGTTSEYLITVTDTAAQSTTTYTTTETSYLLPGLDEQTFYTVSVQPDCGGDYGTAVTVSFTTPCVAPLEVVNNSYPTSTYSTEGHHFPMSNHYLNSFTEQIYLPGELDNASGEFSGMSFQYNDGQVITRTLDIYMAHTADNEFVQNVWATPLDSYVHVYSGPVTFSNTGANRWVDIAFDTNFYYNGSDNLLLIVNDITGSSVSNSNSKFYTINYTANRSQCEYNNDAATSWSIANMPSTGRLHTQVDNIRLTACDAVSCIAPNTLSVGATDAYSAEFSWYNPNVSQSVEVEYKAEGDADWSSAGTVSGTSYLLAGLDANTQYQVRVRSICGTNDYSEWSETVGFRTECEAIVTLPYSNNFDSDTYGSGTEAYIYCWDRYTTDPSKPVQLYPTSAAHTTPNALRFYDGANVTNIAIMPRVDESISLSELQVSFWVRSTSASAPVVLELGVMTDKSDPTTFEILDTIPAPYQTGDQYTLVEYSLANYTGYGQYIAFRASNGNGGNNLRLDDVTLDYIPVCQHPVGLSVSNITSETADLTWSEVGTATSWYVEYGPAGFEAGTGTTQTAYDTAYTLTGLNPNTQYDVYVWSDCSGLESTAIDAAFRTDCGPIVELPFSEDFEDASAIYSSASQQNYIVCWNRYASDPSHYVYIPSNTYAHSGTHFLDFHWTPSCYNIAIMPALDQNFNVSDLMVSFYACRSGSSGTLEVGVMTDPAADSTFVPVDTIDLSAYSTYQYALQQVSFVNYDGTGSYVAFRVSNAANCGFYIDDVLLEERPDCMYPTNLHATNVSDESVTLAWTEVGTATDWNILYGASGFDPETEGTQVYADATPYTVTGLQTITEYDFYVQADCGGATSQWTGPITLTTGVYTMGTSGSDTLTTCGSIIYDNGGPDGNYSTSSSYTLVVYPATEGSGLQITGTGNLYEYTSYPTYSSYLYFYEGVGTDGPQIASYTGSNLDIAVASSGPITIRFTSSYYAASGFELTAVCSDCTPPSNVTVTDIDTNNATISWSGNASDYAVYLSGAATGYYTTSDTSLLLTDLVPASSYGVQVRALCDGDSSMLSPVTHFTSGCAPITVTTDNPWTEDFEGYTSSTLLCWETPVTYTNGSSVFPLVYRNYGESAHSGGNTIEFKGTSNMLVFPEFTNDIHELRMSFWATNYGSGTSAVVGVITDIADTSTFEAVGDAGTPGPRGGSAGGNGNFMGPFDFSGVQATAGRIAILFTGPGASAGWNTDDFTVSLIPTCSAPSFNSVTVSNVTDNSAEVSFTDDNASHSAWAIHYGETGASADTWSSMNVTSPTGNTLSGLNSNTNYSVYVVTVCDGVEGDEQTSTVTFTTTTIPTTLPYTTDFEDAADNQQWGMINGTQANQWYIGAPTNTTSEVNTTTGGTNGLYISNDNGATNAYTSTESRVYAYRDILVPDGTTELLLSFDWKAQGGLYNYEFLRVYWLDPSVNLTPGNNPPSGLDASAQPGNYGPDATQHWLSQQSSWQHQEMVISADQFAGMGNGDRIYRLAFHWRNTSYNSQPPAAVDNIELRAVTCAAPTGLQVSNVGESEATVSWVGTADSYGVTVTSAAGTDYQTTTANSLTLTGLNASTPYQVTVRGYCGTDSSMVSQPVNFTTACGAVSVAVTPWSTGFEGTDDQILNCWVSASTGSRNGHTYPHIEPTASIAHSGSSALEVAFGDIVTALPLFVEDISQLQVSFWAYNNHWSSQNAVLELGYMTNPYDSSTFVSLQSLTDQSYTQTTRTFADLTGLNLPGTTRIAFRFIRPNGSSDLTSWYIDDIEVSLAATGECDAPTGLVVSNLTDNSATATWTAGGTETSWNVQYKASSAADWTESVANTTSYTMDNLTAGTAYQVRVQAICGDGSTSLWTAPVNFTTTGGSTTTDPTVTTTAATAIAQTTATLNGTVTNPDNVTIVTKGFQWRQTAGGTYATVLATGSALTYNLTNLTANTNYTYRAFITFSGQTVYGNEVTFTTLEQGVEPCAVPTGLHTTDIQNEAVTIEWDANANVNSWNIQYRVAGANTWSTATSNTNSYTVTGLTGLTNYEFQVQADCGDGNVSDWSQSATAQTTNVGIANWLENSIVLFPNPANSMLNVQCAIGNESAAIELLDVYGKLLQTVSVTGEITTVNVSGLADGMYFVRVTTDRGVVTKSFVKR